MLHTDWRPLARPLAAIALAALLAGAARPGLAQTSSTPPITERTQQKRQAETERAALSRKLADLKRQIERTESARGHASDALASSEAAISDANRNLRQLSAENRQTAARLAALVKEHAELTKEADAQNAKLGQMLREQYVGGNQDRLKLLLSGDNPNRIGRELQYHGYVSQAQAQLIEELRANLQNIEKNRAATLNAKRELDEIAQEQRRERTRLEQEKARRATLLAGLSDKLAAQRKEAGSLAQDEQRMGRLVDRLTKLIEEQRKAEAEAARLRAERQKQLAARPAARPRPADAIEDDPNPNAQAGGARPPAVAAGTPFAALRGKLAAPLRGELSSRYGSQRPDGPSSKGLFIRAPEGSEVRAVAGGRVVFAEWLRGFGNLLIVDHGSQYMTIYGNNQALLKRAGDAVRSGEVIAAAGNSGGSDQSGLYFEMRHQGRAFDPLGWITFR